MSVVIRAHFDGKAIIPDEPVDLPVNQPLEAELTVVGNESGRSAEREAAWQRMLSLRIAGVCIPEDALRRENMYEDRL